VVEARVKAHADGIRDRAASGDEAFGRLLRQGMNLTARARIPSGVLCH
jgi:hypothetical protein